jgi:hypothetical protein
VVAVSLGSNCTSSHQTYVSLLWLTASPGNDLPDYWAAGPALVDDTFLNLSYGSDGKVSLTWLPGTTDALVTYYNGDDRIESRVVSYADGSVSEPTTSILMSPSDLDTTTGLDGRVWLSYNDYDRVYLSRLDGTGATVVPPQFVQYAQPYDPSVSLAPAASGGGVDVATFTGNRSDAAFGVYE